MLRQWVNDSEFAGLSGFTQSRKIHLIATQDPAESIFVIPQANGSPPIAVTGLSTFVTTKAAAYVFLPSITGIRIHRQLSMKGGRLKPALTVDRLSPSIPLGNGRTFTMSATGLVVVIIGAWLALPVTAAVAQDEVEKVGKPEKLAKDAEWALASLYEKEPATKTLAEKAQAILVFPITRASVGVGVQRGTAHC